MNVDTLEKDKGKGTIFSLKLFLMRTRDSSLKKTQILFHKCLRYKVLSCRRNHKHSFKKCFLRASYVLGGCGRCWRSSDDGTGQEVTVDPVVVS